MADNTCMSPQTGLPSFMAMTSYGGHHMPQQLQQQMQQMQAAAGVMAAAAQVPTAAANSPHHAHQSHHNQNAAAHHHVQAALAMTSPQHLGQPPVLEGFVDSERRSSSIATLRLKAREHSASMGILSAYGK